LAQCFDYLLEGGGKNQNPHIFSSLKTKSIITLHFKNAKAHFKLDFYWLNILSDFLEGGGTNIKPTYFYFYLKKKINYHPTS
jgi:hypothetical protein